MMDFLPLESDQQSGNGSIVLWLCDHIDFQDISGAKELGVFIFPIAMGSIGELLRVSQSSSS